MEGRVSKSKVVESGDDKRFLGESFGCGLKSSAKKVLDLNELAVWKVCA